MGGKKLKWNALYLRIIVTTTVAVKLGITKEYTFNVLKLSTILTKIQLKRKILVKSDVHV